MHLLGRMLGQELVSPVNSRKLRCSIVVFVCWALFVASGLTFYLFYFAFAKHPVRLDTGLNETWFLRRADWLSMPEYAVDFLNLPVKYVIIGHGAGYYCKHKYSCIKNVLMIQGDHLRRKWDDIGSNYLIGGNGLVFEGRGANVLGVMVPGFNRRCISIMFLGNYDKNRTTKEQFDHLRILLDQLVKLGSLTHDYIIYGHCQVTTHIYSPGRYV